MCNNNIYIMKNVSEKIPHKSANKKYALPGVA